ncbi:C45 family autoproteolytic acyltransferase/hydolase [Nocardia panacis]|nr:C45 family peptidase [Nocardia panacis]
MIEIEGGARQRGLTYGEAAREQIRASIDYYRGVFAACDPSGAPGLQWPDVLAAARGWRRVIARAAPELLIEMDAIAEGADLHEDEILALNARTEILTRPDFGFGECCAFALVPEATADGHVYCGQNWDWRAGAASSVVSLRIVQPPKPTIVMPVEAGQIARHGANSAGIALNASALDGAFGTPTGLPQTILRRMILDADNLHDALAVPYNHRQQIAANLLFTHRDGITIDLETTPLGHNHGEPRAGVLVHGNHYRYGTPDAARKLSAIDSLFRVQVIERGLAAARAGDVRAIIARTLSDHSAYPHSVCCHPDERAAEMTRYKTIASSIVDLTTGEFLVTGGNPCENDYRPLPWNLFDGPPGVRYGG